jgi:L-amino acid N-acyltransferase YncA
MGAIAFPGKRDEANRAGIIPSIRVRTTEYSTDSVSHPSHEMLARAATPADDAAITSIYNQGIEDRIATFETRLRRPDEIEAWFDGRHPIAVVEWDGRVIAFAATSMYRPRACYEGVAEVSVYVDRQFRRRGAGRLVLAELIKLAEGAGFWKLLSRIFPENRASLALIASLDFREVGLYQKHGHLDGTWRDVIIVERLISSNLR